MKEMARYGLVLSLICVVASASLALVNRITKPRIIAQARAEEEASLKEVMPEAIRFEAVKSGGSVLYYKAYGPDAKIIGAAFKAAHKGYSSVVETMVGMKIDGTICAIKVVSQNETPGLGARISEPSFAGQFKNKDIDLDGVQAITGATISSRAVIDAVKEKAREIEGLIKDAR
ncbi:MAG: RnfABCDGE type electron transport complex subunit G [Candidatus Omnitrophota bacterium]